MKVSKPINTATRREDAERLLKMYTTIRELQWQGRSVPRLEMQSHPYPANSRAE